MAALKDMRRSTRLTFLDQLPCGFFDCGARDLHRILVGPTLIELAGEREPPLFVSILLHGNEDSGLTAVQHVLKSLSLLPRSLMLLVGNVEAARQGQRRLDDQPDYNRIWPGAPNTCDTAEACIMAEVHKRALKRRAVAAIDLHNNTGRNPHYSVVCNLEPPTLKLAGLFSRRAVLFRGIPGTQTASFAGLIPAITAECGRPGEVANAEAAARMVTAALSLDELSDAVSEKGPLDLYHTRGVVRIKADVDFDFGSGDAELRLDPAIDEHNFRDLEPGTELGQTSHPMPLQMIDETGRDVAEQYFVTSGGKLRLRTPAVPAMFTTDRRIVRQDCLCYLMERL
jgi:succinylglutamate desuccinylase